MQEGPEGVLYISPLEYSFTQFRVLITYLRLIILPVNQNLDYDYPVAHSFINLQTIASFLFLLGFLASGILAFKKHRIISFAIFWFFLTLSIESSFIPIRDVIFEHRLYLPMAGLSFAIVIVLYNLLWQNSARLFYSFMIIVIACFAMLTFVRNHVWSDEVTLWSDAIKKAPNKVRPYNNRGRAYGNRGEYDKAMADFRQAITINPRCAEAYYNLGLVYALKGDNDKALEQYNQALNLYPNYTAAYNNRGLVLVNKKEFDRAVKDYDKALSLSPRSSDVYYNRGLAYYHKQVFDKAIADYSQALLLNPRYGNAYHNRAIAYYMTKEYQKALDDLAKMQQFGFKVDVKLQKALRDKAKEDR
jgi:tetratricopeptide (TPR) repeat protein